MSKQTGRKAGAAVLGAGFVVSLAAVTGADAADNPFEVTQFRSGYMVAAEGACGGGKAGEGACGGEMATDAADDAKAATDADQQAEGSDGAGGKSTEGKCGN